MITKIMKIHAHNPYLPILIYPVVLASAVLPASADSATWLGASDPLSLLWADGTNWSVIPVPGTGDTATFDNAGNANTVIDLGAGVTVNALLFDTVNVAAYTIGSGTVGSQTLTLNDGGTITLNNTIAQDQLINAQLALGTSATITNNDSAQTLTIAGGITGTGSSLAKTGAGTLILSGLSTTAVNNYTGTTILGGGTTTITQDASFSGGLTFGTAASNLNLNGASATFAGPMEVLTEDVINTITIGAGEKLTINGNVTSGTGNQGRLTVSGAGGWDVISSDGTFGGGGTDNNNADFVVDLSALADFDSNLRTGGFGADGGLFRIGPISKTGTNTRSHTVSLATNSTISADTVVLAMAGAPGTSTLTLGNGTQIINSDNITVGGSSRESALLNFGTADGTLKIRGTDGDNATRSNMSMMTGSTGSGTKTSTFDVTGHVADLLFDTVKIYDLTTSPSSSATDIQSATFSFDQGTLDATTFQIGTKSAGTLQSQGIGSANIGSSANLTNSATFGAVNMGVLSTGSVGANGSLSSTLNITGSATTVSFGTMSMLNSPSADADADVVGAVNISGGSVTGTGGIDMLTARTAGSADSTLTISGGSLSVGTSSVSATNGIYRTATTGATTLVLSGGSLDLNGNAIGGAGANAITTQFESGTLSDVGEINGGAGLTKTTSGTLVLTGTNTYTGTTAVNEGTLSMSSPGLADASAVTIATDAVLHLDYDGTDTVGSLSVGGGPPLESGTYDKDSPETTGFITGDGQLFVDSSPYDIWVALYQPGFTNSLPSQDQDGDGLTNQEEFAFGLNPKSGSSVNPITTGLDTASGNFSFTHNANSGLDYKVWSSPDLATWTLSITADLTPVGTPDSFGTQTVDVTNLGATPVDGKLFVRVTAE